MKKFINKSDYVVDIVEGVNFSYQINYDENGNVEIKEIKEEPTIQSINNDLKRLFNNNIANENNPYYC